MKCKILLVESEYLVSIIVACAYNYTVSWKSRGVQKLLSTHCIKLLIIVIDKKQTIPFESKRL